MLRIYPKGTRVNSSNYKPQNAWLHGAQMVAFNMQVFSFLWDQIAILPFSSGKINLVASLQGHGKSLSLMRGMFRSNGSCGYVKKPDFLLTVDPHGKVFDPNENLPVKRTLKVGICQTRSCIMFCWLALKNIIMQMPGESLHGCWLEFGFWKHPLSFILPTWLLHTGKLEMNGNLANLSPLF